MKLKTGLWILGIILALAIIGNLLPDDSSETELKLNESTTLGSNTEENIKIANWNLQIFGNTKASNTKLMNTYSSIMDDYDIIFIQEIRNKDQTAFPKLCGLLLNYNCETSSRAGRSTSKEQYGIIYKKGIEITNLKDFNPDSQDRWERPPIEVTFDIGGYELIAYNIHIKPDDAGQEIDYLEDVVKTSSNVIVLGDLNADCSFYNEASEPDFDSWNWVIKDNEDTTVSSTNCAYDRIILNSDAFGEYVSDGIYTQGINSDVSDHYLVWVQLRLDSIVPPTTKKTPIEEQTEKSSSSSNVICSSNVYNCGDFSSCSEVMEVFHACSSDVHKLDRDDDGIPCESLCG